MKRTKTYTNLLSSKWLFSLIFIFISVLLVLTPCNSSLAFANISGQDKLYGQELTQRKLSVAYCPNITAKYAALMDSAGNLIYERASTESAKIASMTKIMTAIVGLENTDPSETITISKAAAEVGESSAGLWAGDTLTMDMALHALMVPSGNDAAVAISEYVGQKAIDNSDTRLVLDYDEEGEPSEVVSDKNDAFALLMNLKAQEIGCVNTLFTNPHGLDDDVWESDSHSCARDMIYITKYAMQNYSFRKVVGGGDCVITVTRDGAPKQIELTSTDILLGAYEGCIGVKTGHTDEAGACFSGAARDKANNEIYTVVMHADDEAERFRDTQKLFDWYFENLSNYCPAANSDVTIDSNLSESGEVKVVAYCAHNQWADTTFPLSTQNQNDTIPVLSFAGNVYLSLDDQHIEGDYKCGDYVCDLVLSQHNIEVGRMPLYAAKDQPSPNFFQQIGVGIDRAIKSITGKQTTASSYIISSTDSVNPKE